MDLPLLDALWRHWNGHAAAVEGGAEPAPLAPGDVVVLKSGGPKMTVVGEGMTGHVNVAWFDGGKMEQASLKAAALRRAKR